MSKSEGDLITKESKVKSETEDRELYKVLVKDAMERYTNYLAAQSHEDNTESSPNKILNDCNDARKPAHRPETTTPKSPLNPKVIKMFERNDILFGRGKNERNHFGNRHLRTICRERLSTYEAADREEKTEISKDIVKEIQSMGGRFLKLNVTRDAWLLVSDDDARKKVSHLMRDARQLGSDVK